MPQFSNLAASLPDDIWKWHAWQIAGAIRHGHISSREAVKSCLQRIENINPLINALSGINAEAALRMADAADEAVKGGRVLGQLHGVPVTIKCNVDVKGQATTNGVAARVNLIATENSPVVDNLLAGGAVIVGRSNAPTFAMRWFTDNKLHGRTLNPWNDALTPGGSSGGAGAAVAAGMCPIGHGNDIGGSIRYPAYACGVYGLRPTVGRIPAYVPSAGDVKPFTFQQFAVQGPITRCVRDLRLSLDVMCKGDLRDPDWSPTPFKGAALARPIKVALVDEISEVPIAQEVRGALSQAASWLVDEGFVVEKSVPPGLYEAMRLWLTLVMTDLRPGVGPLIEQSGDGDAIRALNSMYAYVGQVSLESFVKAFALRNGLRRKWNEFFDEYPVILMPTSLQLPFSYDADLGGDHAMARIIEAQLPLLATSALNYPCVSVPTGLYQGKPVGVQIVTGSFREDLCLHIAEKIESHARMPNVF
ncbi:amidase family protein [Burkholderia gladioli]|uniref:amidase family protein n=1 Tax=Burkholderia gladioli TaxID=28095 RepID=UPI00164063A8|nr:amidase family protein [Burkholderia gladioli]